ncbi:hypothetical protein FACS189420_2300 [Bacteroidia bacterium]|nr:hypothetical protein FACS18947_7210 [Bacteroidia bacterium]GHV70588.1 hypothetical protein FACS189420_2300 [Bacteroidia bacterium]
MLSVHKATKHEIRFNGADIQKWPLQSAAPIEDATIAATYIQLQAEDLDLGSCWSQVAGRETSR